jgi:hypothetical protein
MKRIRIIFRCWKAGKPYDEKLYMDSKQERNHPLGVLSTTFEWKDAAGFKNFG